METTDKQFYLAFTGVLAALTLITIAVMVVANLAGGQLPQEKSEVQLEKMQARVAPVGQVNLASVPNPDLQSLPAIEIAAAPTQTGAQPQAVSGESVYNGICRSCHDTGLLEAPKLGDKAVWNERLKNGIDSLYLSALNGKGLMAPKGGNPGLSDAEVKAAVDYMVEKAR